MSLVFEPLSPLSGKVRVNFGLVPMNHKEYLILTGEGDAINIMVYSADLDQWRNLSTSPIHIPRGFECSYFYHIVQNKLYICSAHEPKIQCVELETGTITCASLYQSFYPRCVLGMDNILFINSLDSYGHRDLKAVEGVKLQEIDVSAHCTYMLPRRIHREVICCLETEPDFCTSLYRYDLDSDSTTCLPWTHIGFPDVSWSGCVTTLDERYLIQFGGISIECCDGPGSCMRQSCTDDIIIFDFLKEAVYISEIRCPKAMAFHAVSLGMKENDELMCFGWVRLSSPQLIPIYLIQLMLKWYVNERIFLLGWDHQHECDSPHWKVDIDAVLRNKVSIKRGNFNDTKYWKW